MSQIVGIEPIEEYNRRNRKGHILQFIEINVVGFKFQSTQNSA